MELTVHERLVLRNILPTQGVPFGTLKLANKVNNSLFNDAEWKALEVKQMFECPECSKQEAAVERPTCEACKKPMKGLGRLVWRLTDDEGTEVEQVKDVAFGDRAKELIKQQLEHLEEAGEANMGFLSLWEKFCENGTAIE